MFRLCYALLALLCRCEPASDSCGTEACAARLLAKDAAMELAMANNVFFEHWEMDKTQILLGFLCSKACLKTRDALEALIRQKWEKNRLGQDFWAKIKSEGIGGGMVPEDLCLFHHRAGVTDPCHCIIYNVGKTIVDQSQFYHKWVVQTNAILVVY